MARPRPEPEKRIGLLTGCGNLVTNTAFAAGWFLLSKMPGLPAASSCATDLVRRPDGTWWRCGQLESTAAELAEAAATAEAGAYWP